MESTSNPRSPAASGENWCLVCLSARIVVPVSFNETIAKNIYVERDNIFNTSDLWIVTTSFQGLSANRNIEGCAIAQEFSRWLPTVAAWVRALVRSCGICGGQGGTGAGSLRVLWFPLPIFSPPIAPQSPSSGTRTIGQ
jgi:hypothetical protein